jgi:hypothetical protein
VAQVQVVWSDELRGRDGYIRRAGRLVLVILPGWLRGTAHGQRLCAEALGDVFRLDVAV